MTRVLKAISEINDKQDRINFLIENRKEILFHKKMMPKKMATIKADSSLFIEPTLDVNSLMLEDDEVLIVGNSINFFDSHDDVSLRGSWNKTIADKGNRIPILKDHQAKIDSLFAENIETSIKEMPIRGLGYDAEGMTEVVTAKIKPYKFDDLMKYKRGSIKEHSMALKYKKIFLAINDEKDEESYKLFNAYIDNIINKDEVLEKGYFFGVEEQEAIEFSAVVFASNALTPAFTNKDESLEDEPPKSTQKDEPIINVDFLRLIY